MFQRRSRPRLLPWRYLALGCSLLLYQRYYLICPSRRGKTSDPVFQPRKQRFGRAKCLSSSHSWGQAASVPKPRALSPSPELLPEAPFTSKVIGMDWLCSQSSSFISKLSLSFLAEFLSGIVYLWSPLPAFHSLLDLLPSGFSPHLPQILLASGQQ